MAEYTYETRVVADLERNDEQVAKLLRDIDAIVAAGSAEGPERQPDDEERRGLLRLAALLARVDFTSPKRKSFNEFITEIQSKHELEDNGLDLVAGGRDLSWFWDNDE